jgi:hypothetical protein
MGEPTTRPDEATARPDPVPVRSIHASVHARLVTAHLREELHDLAWDLVGRPERDELAPADRQRLQAEVDIAVEQVLATTITDLRADLTDRVEALPVSIRVPLANVRRRRDLGFD